MRLESDQPRSADDPSAPPPLPAPLPHRACRPSIVGDSSIINGLPASPNEWSESNFPVARTRLVFGVKVAKRTVVQRLAYLVSNGTEGLGPLMHPQNHLPLVSSSTPAPTPSPAHPRKGKSMPQTLIKHRLNQTMIIPLLFIMW